MVSTIAENMPFECMSIKHLGVVKNGVDLHKTGKENEWPGAVENYVLKIINNKTALTIEMDMTAEFRDYLTETWPKTLAKLKEMAERKPVAGPTL